MSCILPRLCGPERTNYLAHGWQPGTSCFILHLATFRAHPGQIECIPKKCTSVQDGIYRLFHSKKSVLCIVSNLLSIAFRKKCTVYGMESTVGCNSTLSRNTLYCSGYASQTAKGFSYCLMAVSPHGCYDPPFRGEFGFSTIIVTAEKCIRSPPLIHLLMIMHAIVIRL